MTAVRPVRVLLALICLLGSVIVGGQEATPTAAGVNVQTGLATTGRLDDRSPRQIYTFEGSRGEVVRITVTVRSGDLDAVLTVFDASGALLLMRDDAADRNTIAATLTLESDSRYFIVVGRFGYEVGTTRGDYELTLERVGVVSAQGTTLIYGIPVTDTISNTQPQVYYTFRAEAGDILTVDMQRTSGTLDPYLQILNRDRFVVASNDDVAEGGSHNARIDNFLVEETGVYIVVATRYGEASGDSVGNYILSVYEGSNSGIGNSTLAPEEILYNQPTEGELNAARPQRYYRFSAREDDVISISMVRTSGSLDSYLVLADSSLRALAEDDDSGGGKNALIEGFRIPGDGEYIVMAMRFGVETGDTQGGYRLQIQYRGSAFERVNPGIPRLLYGTTVPDRISNEDPDSLYAFWGQRGDIVTLTMTRVDGNLDPVLVLMDSEQRRLISDDDSGGAGNALIARYNLPYTGVYYINARRYEGAAGDNQTEGSFNVVLVKLPG
jgi:hypothetical protein